MTWYEDEYRRRMKARGYEPTMDGMDDQDIKDALEAMDRRNAARQQDEWQYPRYKPVDPGLQARILRMFGQPYDKSAIDPKEAHYLNGGWDDDDDDDPPQAKPMQNLLEPPQGRERQPDKPWTLNWGKNGNMFGAKPQNFQYRPRQDTTQLSSRGEAFQPMSYGGPPSYRQDGLQMAYSQPSAAASKKYIQEWYDANVWTDPDVLAAATPAEREAAVHRIIASRGGGELLRHYNALNINENDAEAARMNDVKYVVSSLGKVQDTPDDSGTGQDATGKMSYGPSGHDAGVHMKDGVNNPYAGGYMDAGTSRNDDASSGTEVTTPYGLVKPIATGTEAGYVGDSGLDISAPMNTPVMAAAGGKVIYAEAGHTTWQRRDPVTGEPIDTPYSVLIELDTPITFKDGRQARYVWYTHMSKLAFEKGDGDTQEIRVKPGQVVGYSGTANDSPHLHFGVLIDRKQGEGDYFTPVEVREMLGIKEKDKW